MPRTWQLQEAKNKFSQLVESARTEGPQFVTRHGKNVVVILSAEAYQKMTDKQHERQPQSLVQFFRESPLAELALELERDKSLPRDD
ncbi:MAG: type II toxin-antitoxin system Phd/YefM family antitoxin [Candidatus Sericytochromatia bacterium]